jgi:hypothetical protein
MTKIKFFLVILRAICFVEDDPQAAGAVRVLLGGRHAPAVLLPRS